jgi:hypothetical protein
MEKYGSIGVRRCYVICRSGGVELQRNHNNCFMERVSHAMYRQRGHRSRSKMGVRVYGSRDWDNSEISSAGLLE